MMKSCALEGIEVAYEEVGQGRSILFLHGWTLDHTAEQLYFEPIFETRPGWRRLYIDLPGHGRTPGPEQIDCMDAILEVILAFIDTVAPGERLALAGTSAGALPARGVVYRRPEQVIGLLARNPLIVADDAQRTLPEPTILIEDEAFMAQLSAAERKVFGDILVQKASYYDEVRRFDKFCYQPAVRIGDSACRDRIRQESARYGLSFDVDALPQAFEGPSLFLTGRQDPVVGYQDAWPVLEQYPRASFMVLDRASHDFPADQKTLFKALVDDWLDRMEEYEAYR
jgi:pimeloyl-ACP methyl ester carboxylesterase